MQVNSSCHPLQLYLKKDIVSDGMKLKGIGGGRRSRKRQRSLTGFTDQKVCKRREHALRRLWKWSRNTCSYGRCIVALFRPLSTSRRQKLNARQSHVNRSAVIRSGNENCFADASDLKASTNAVTCCNLASDMYLLSFFCLWLKYFTRFVIQFICQVVILELVLVFYHCFNVRSYFLSSIVNVFMIF